MDADKLMRKRIKFIQDLVVTLVLVLWIAGLIALHITGTRELENPKQWQFIVLLLNAFMGPAAFFLWTQFKDDQKL